MGVRGTLLHSRRVGGPWCCVPKEGEVDCRLWPPEFRRLWVSYAWGVARERNSSGNPEVMLISELIKMSSENKALCGVVVN